MKLGIDTSVLLRLLVGEPPDQAEVALEALEEWTAGGGSIVVSRLVLAETYYALQHHYDVPKQQALRQLLAFAKSSWVTSDSLAIDTLSTPRLATVKPGFVDRLIYAEYRFEKRAELMVTFDKAAGKLDGIQVLRA